MNVVESIITELNAILKASLPFGNTAFYGDTELVTVDEKSFPRCLQDKKGGAILPDRARPLTIYHRVRRINVEESEEESFGLNTDDLLTAEIQLFGVGDQMTLSKDVRDINQTLAMMVAAGFPGGYFPAASTPANANRIRLSGPLEISQNKTEILSSELSGIEILNKMERLVAFRIDYTIQAHLCAAICT